MSNETVDVPIDSVSELWKTRLRLMAEIEERRDTIDQIDTLIKSQLPDEEHVTATIDGRPVFTYGITQRFKDREFRDEYPQYYKEYLEPTVKDVFNWRKFRDSHPALAQQFMVRALTPTRPRRHGS